MELIPPLTSRSSKGTSHWVMQRITAIVLIPLSFWCIVFLNKCLNAPYHETVAWLVSPLNAICILAWLFVVFYHAALGLQVVIEDYVATESIRIIASWAINLCFIFLALISLFEMLNILSIG